MHIHVLPAGPIATNAYLLTDPAGGDAVLIDAPGGILGLVEPILRRERCKLRELWLTHGHWDHMQDAAAVVRATGALVRAHPADRALLETPEVMSAFLLPGMTLEPVRTDRELRAGERLAAAGLEAEVRHVPGHCAGNVLFYFPAVRAAFVGDALFAGGVGRTDFPGGSMETLARSIRTQIYTLPDDTAVYPGHGPATTVGREKADNPFVPAAGP